ncbi:hypothetical protein [uncultured Anaerofustis sp.]|uniref:hypothetical protein n=1 Tax=uncultured Anaerofustis sp. TaxID=904996 RepID=UPI0025E68E6B|nr:hypothetical protein [uncultured Anaerofustis sp.]
MAKSENYKIFERKLKDVNSKKKRLSLLEQLDSLDEEILNERDRISKELSFFESALDSLEDMDKNIIESNYIEKISMVKIAEETNYATSVCSRKKVKAVKNLMYLMTGIKED